ncbi:VanZ family protein [Maioricimonas sp. JC845]|uniref:VanZ family protein n=1 Tax=Maioricimonas sp. JC845 TaxID=3232138 RepID=UPI00345A28BD
MSVRTSLTHLLLGPVGGLIILTFAGLSLICLVVLRQRDLAAAAPARKPSSETTVRQLAAWMVGATAAFALYGSLLPFNFEPLTTEGFRQGFQQFLGGLQHRPSERDFYLNMTLFLPFGYGLFAWLEPRPSWNVRLIGTLAFLPFACLMVSLPAEFGQIWLQGRVCSPWDVAAHLVGTAGGAIGWVLTSRTVVRHMPDSGEKSSAGSARLVLYAYIAFLVLASLYPFDIIPDLSAIAEASRRGRVQLQLIVPTTPPELKELIFHAFFSVPLGVLAASVFYREGKVRYLPALLLGAALAVGVEFLQLFVRSRFTQLTFAVAGTIGAWTGTVVAARMTVRRQTGEENAAGGHPARWLGLAMLYSLFPLFFFTWPTDLTKLLSSPQLDSLQTLPFQRLHQASPLNASTQLLQKVLLYIPTGYFCATAILLARSRLERQLVGVVATGVIFAGPIAVEGLQLYLPDHTADVTDVLLGTFGGLIGCLTVQAARQGIAVPIGVCMETGLLNGINPVTPTEFLHFMRDDASICRRELTQSSHGSRAEVPEMPPFTESAEVVDHSGPVGGSEIPQSTQYAVARPDGRGYPVRMSHSEYASACGMSGPLRLVVETRQGVGTSYTFMRPTVLVGRIDGCDLQLESPEVARRHLLLQVIDGRWAWFDLTGLAPRESGWLNPRNRLQCGPFTIRLHDDADKPAPSLQHQGAVRNDRGFDYQLSFHNALQAQSGPKSRRLRDLVTIVGRVPPAHIRLAHPTVSRVHCLIVNTHRGLWLTDLASTSGTFVNERLVDVAPLSPGDEIHIGDYDVTLTKQDAPLTGTEPLDDTMAEARSDADLPAVSASSWPALLPRLSDDDIATPTRSGPTAELSGKPDAMLGTLLEHFSAMQREMMQQSQQQMMMMMQMFGQLQKTQLEAIREDLKRVQEITRELCEAQAQFAAEENRRREHPSQDGSPPAHAAPPGGIPQLPGQATWLPGLTPPDVDDTDEVTEASSRPRASHQDVSAHAQLSERIRVLERERNSRWQKIVSFLSTGS